LVQITSIQLYTAGANVALYAAPASGTCPGALLWSGSTTSGATGWQTATVSPPIGITPGSTYYLASESSTPSIGGPILLPECFSSNVAGGYGPTGQNGWISRVNGVCE
jgi:hypothetical protein